MVIQAAYPSWAADDYTTATNAAYCSGAVARNIELTRKSGLTTRDDDLVYARFAAVLSGALKKQLVSPATSRELASIGAQDAQLCWDIGEQCEKQSTKRLADPKFDAGRNVRLHENCRSEGDAVCARLNACK